MKKLIIVLASLLSIITVQAQVRSCNLEVTLLSPIEYDFVQTNKPMDVNVSVKNLGPGVITVKDTFIYTLKYDGDSVYSASKPIQKGYYGYDISVGQSVTQILFGGGIIQNYNTGGVHIYCVDLKLMNRSTTDGSSDPVLTNNSGCHHVYVTTFNVGVSGKSLQVNDFTVSPNPANGNTSISYTIAESSEINITLMDLQGREVLQLLNKKAEAGTYNQSVDLSGLKAGVYFVKYANNGMVKTSKLVVQ